MTIHRQHRRAVCLAFCGSLLCAPAFSAPSESASYVLQQATVDGAGADASSASYRLDASLDQRATVGTSSSPAWVLQSGFWSFVGSGLVPVWLSVDKNAVTLGHVDLSWSGNNAPYDVYQSADCANVFASWLGTTGTNGYDDVAPPAAGLVCYSVLATAPGPAPPPDP